jgi:hypothetical protein
LARGFESKDVEFQQAEAERLKVSRRALTPEERASREERRTIELSLARAKAELARARSNAHRQMLDDAIASLQRRLDASEP